MSSTSSSSTSQRSRSGSESSSSSKTSSWASRTSSKTSGRKSKDLAKLNNNDATEKKKNDDLDSSQSSLSSTGSKSSASGKKSRSRSRSRSSSQTRSRSPSDSSSSSKSSKGSRPKPNQTDEMYDETTQNVDSEDKAINKTDDNETNDDDKSMREKIAKCRNPTPGIKSLGPVSKTLEISDSEPQLDLSTIRNKNQQSVSFQENEDVPILDFTSTEYEDEDDEDRNVNNHNSLNITQNRKRSTKGSPRVQSCRLSKREKIKSSRTIRAKSVPMNHFRSRSGIHDYWRKREPLFEPRLHYYTYLDEIQEARPMVDTRPPQTYMHLHLKLKKLQLEEERLSTVERDNRILLEKMSYIMRTKGRVDNKNNYEYKSLNREKRMRELLRVTQENREILRRITQRQPEYDHVKWDEDWEENQKFMDQIAAYPKDWWKYREGTMERENSSVNGSGGKKNSARGKKKGHDKQKEQQKEEGTPRSDRSRRESRRESESDEQQKAD